MNGFFSAVSGGAAQEVWLEKVSNNLANVNTTGYKGDYPAFESILLGDAGSKGKASSSVALVRINEGIDMSQGPIKRTGNPLDLAIEGPGFFVVDTPQGTRYTRSGNFSMSSEGVLTTLNGYSVMGERGEVHISGKDVAVTEDGTVFVDGKKVDRLRVVDIDGDRYLGKEGDNLFSLRPGGKEVEPEGAYILQGAIENSNVKVVAEMTRLINISRAYEACQKIIHSMDEVSSKAINEVGKVG